MFEETRSRQSEYKAIRRRFYLWGIPSNTLHAVVARLPPGAGAHCSKGAGSDRRLGRREVATQRSRRRIAASERRRSDVGGGGQRSAGTVPQRGASNTYERWSGGGGAAEGRRGGDGRSKKWIPACASSSRALEEKPKMKSARSGFSQRAGKTFSGAGFSRVRWSALRWPARWKTAVFRAGARDGAAAGDALTL